MVHGPIMTAPTIVLVDPLYLFSVACRFVPLQAEAGKGAENLRLQKKGAEKTTSPCFLCPHPLLPSKRRLSIRNAPVGLLHSLCLASDQSQAGLSGWI